MSQLAKRHAIEPDFLSDAQVDKTLNELCRLELIDRP